jgi:hypothetical protein
MQGTYIQRMIRPLALLLLVLAFGPIPLLGTFSPRTAYACSAGDDFDPIGSADLVVGGWITGWHERPELSTMGELQAVEVEINVERVFKGPLPADLVIVDTGSYFPRAAGWYGGSGACGSFDADPSGLYVVAGLTWAEDGTYRMNRLRTLFLGQTASGLYYDKAVTRLTQIAPPVTGSGGLLEQPLSLAQNVLTPIPGATYTG